MKLESGTVLQKISKEERKFLFGGNEKKRNVYQADREDNWNKQRSNTENLMKKVTTRTVHAFMCFFISLAER